jgi:hypothetical protein
VTPDDSESEFSRWLRIQIWLAVGGMVIWLAGAAIENSFVAGVGTGVMASALVLRFVRGKQPDRKSGGDGA